MGSEALELALAVYRTPIKRHALYDMALPHDIGVVLQLASAPQPLLSEVAAEVDESEDTIVEASRFYLQLALFQPEADAYRILGLADDATHERIREHYRWLQRWVHPDRRGEDWEALFATRVNWAWSNLRNETVRRAYDIEYDRSVPAHSDPADEQEVRPQWNPSIAQTHRASRAGQIVFGALLCSCIALLYMVITRDDGVPQDETGTRSTQAEEDSGSAMPSDLQPPASGSYASTPASDASVPEQRSRDATQIVDGGKASKDQDEPSRLADPHEHVAGSPAAQVAPAENNEFPKPLLPRAIPGVTVVQGAGGSAQEAEKPIAATRKPKPADEPKAAADAHSKNAMDHDDSNVPPVEPGTEVQIASTAAVAEKKSNSASPSASATSPAAVEHAVAAAQSTPDKTNLSAGSGGDGVDDALARIDLAHQRVKELSTFFAKLDSRSPPIWNDVAGQSSAEAQRRALYDRAGPRDPADFVVDDPRWRMSENAAALNANYHLLKRNAVSESGRISLSMVWRERMWLVTQVELRPTL